MFSNNFVVCIKCNHEVLEEDRAGNIKIPFDSEYSIFLKNKHDRRATANVKVDGQSVGTFVVDANSSFELKRPEKTNRAFRFVHIDSNAAKMDGKSRKTDGTNGLIEVEWKLEFKQESVKYVPYPVIVPEPVPYYPSRPRRWRHPDQYTPAGTIIHKFVPDTYTYKGNPQVSSNGDDWSEVKTSGGIIPPRSRRITGQSFSASNSTQPYEYLNAVDEHKPISSRDEVGATIEGKSTNQYFIEVDIQTETTSTLMVLSLKGYDISEEDKRKQKERDKALIEIELLRKRLNELEKSI